MDNLYKLKTIKEMSGDKGAQNMSPGPCVVPALSACSFDWAAGYVYVCLYIRQRNYVYALIRQSI